MSLGPTYLCCDDGLVYKCDLIHGDDWDISLEEYMDDELWIKAISRVKHQPRTAPRPCVPPQQIIERDGLPIASVEFKANENHGGREVAVYSIKWAEGQPFPRRLLPSWRTPNSCKVLGTFACYTAAHQRVAISEG